MTKCTAKDPLTCRFHGQEKVVDHLFERNKRMLGWERYEFGPSAEETLRQIVFKIATIDEPRANVPELIATIRKEYDLGSLRSYFDIEAGIAEVAYLYDPHKQELDGPNLLASGPATFGTLGTMYARYLVENGSTARYAPRYLARHGVAKCGGIVAVHDAGLRKNPEDDYTPGAAILEGKVTCACGRLKNAPYEAYTHTEELLRYAMADKTA